MRDERRLSGPENLDRVLLGVCAGVWLLALGAGVAATVALVDLSNGRGSVRAELSGSDTPWVLYTVIGVSAAVIAAAIPLLIRARRDSNQRPLRGVAGSSGSAADDIAAIAARPAGRRRAGTVSATTEGRRPALPAIVDDVYVRCTTGIGCAVGAGVLAVGIGTYLMATGSDTAAWAAYIVAGLITVGMAAIPWFYLRELHAVTGPASV
ncbi:DUF2561 domain-containing protein [Mycolicibacterium cosmeticum]|uniref:Transmembrane protein n=1 Tax=Mycolicibacterium cosmeticum TaxID=258533 RepID=W9AU85_MYCCO|nr:DUF2561 family protein [Mycolicibacterium cosmeticum]TLH71181.1 DUF2561 domain-containing protein [Mycolicibacterium cosmeticum]CDO06472.1 transmembrane protein [Mycolicibacterium cosmeticum]